MNETLLDVSKLASLVTFRFIGELSAFQNPNDGDIVIESSTQDMYVFNRDNWIPIGNSQELNQEYEKITCPTNCVNCGAPLHRGKCEYCGTEYC